MPILGKGKLQEQQGITYKNGPQTTPGTVLKPPPGFCRTASCCKPSIAERRQTSHFALADRRSIRIDQTAGEENQQIDLLRTLRFGLEEPSDQRQGSQNRVLVVDRCRRIFNDTPRTIVSPS